MNAADRISNTAIGGALAELSATDRVLTELLEKSSSDVRARFEIVMDCWRSESDKHVSFTEFLDTAKILSEGAVRTLEMVAKGYLALDGVLAVLSREFEEIARARMGHQVAAPVVAEKDASLVTTRFASRGQRSRPPEPRRLLPGIGDLVGKCRILEVLGTGAASTVYRALHTSLQTIVALKIIVPESDLAGQLDLREEARVLARLDHPNIIRVLDYDVWRGFPYLIVEYVDGVSLADLLVQVGYLSADRAIRIAIHVASALQHAAEAGFSHRDVKPANILIDRKGQIKLADLGLAALTCPGSQIAGQPEGNSSEAIGICGTPAFIAPERIVGIESTPEQSDIYSLGATLFTALTGSPPFTARDSSGVLAAQLNQAAPDIKSKQSGVPTAVCHLISTMLEKNPEHRFQTFSQLLEALDYVARIIDKPCDEETGKYLRKTSQLFREAEVLQKSLQNTSPEHTSTMSMSGELSQIGLSQLLQFLNWTRKTGEIRIESGRKTGGIAIREGDIYHCYYGQVVGIDAFSMLALSSEGIFKFFENRELEANTIQIPTLALLMNTARDHDESTLRS